MCGGTEGEGAEERGVENGTVRSRGRSEESRGVHDSLYEWRSRNGVVGGAC